MEEITGLKFLGKTLSLGIVLISLVIVMDQTILARVFYGPPDGKGGTRSFHAADFTIPDPEPFETYRSAVSRAEVFGGKGLTGLPQAKKTDLKSLAGQWHIRGIAVFDFPEAIVEDTQSNRTLFLKEGDFMGPLKVIKILEEKVMVAFEGETYELAIEKK
jgi:uncharacterized protein (DUF1330 family)